MPHVHSPGELQEAGLYMYFETFGDREGCEPGEVRLGASKVLMFGSNDYLDLITHPQGQGSRRCRRSGSTAADAAARAC